MSDFVLRGICKKCECQIIWDDFVNWEEEIIPGFKRGGHRATNSYGDTHSAEPEWFLSAKQMNTICQSDKFERWRDEESNWDVSNREFALIEFLKTEPFLVSDILKKAGEDK